MDKQGEKIRLLRIFNKILEKDMAKRLFMSASAYSNLERGISKMYLATV
jgi:transcriptional regulator with XRE-family HTH domain